MGNSIIDHQRDQAELNKDNPVIIYHNDTTLFDGLIKGLRAIPKKGKFFWSDDDALKVLMQQRRSTSQQDFEKEYLNFPNPEANPYTDHERSVKAMADAPKKFYVFESGKVVESDEPVSEPITIRVSRESLPFNLGDLH